jgi:hypothetical protein
MKLIVLGGGPLFSDEYSCRRMRIIGEANGTFVT